MKQITISKEALSKLLKHSDKLVKYLIEDESKDYASRDEKDRKDHIYNDVFKASQLIKALDKIECESYINERLEYYESQSTESEIWLDRLTGDYYEIDVEIVRDFSNLTDRKRK